MSYIARRPSPRLAGIVERLWRVESAPRSAVPETICPDGCSELVIHLGDAMRGQPRSLLVGQMDRPITIVPTGRVAMVGARFTPAGLHRLLPIPQDRLAGQIFDLAAVWQAWTHATAEQMADAGTPEGELDVFERALERLVPDGTRRDHGLDAVVGAMRANGGKASITKLAARLGVSRRQLERRFRAEVGLSPRVFARIVRFQRAFQALGHESGASIAARCGFADQAHLVREVRRFGGHAPSALAAAEGLTTFFRQ